MSAPPLLQQIIPEGIATQGKEFYLIEVPIDYDVSELKHIKSTEPREISETEQYKTVLESLPHSIQSNLIDQLYLLAHDSTTKQWTKKRFHRIMKINKKLKRAPIKKKAYRVVTKIRLNKEQEEGQ